MTSSDEILRGESMAALFARGDLDEILARHLRGAARSDDDRAAVIGAYAWSGRLDEATAQHQVFLADLPTVTYRELARCHLIIGMCHAGELGAARRSWRAARAEPLAADSPLWFARRYARAFIAYFQGRMDRCQRAAQRALRAAVRNGDAFGQLLAHDLLAHTRWHLGFVRDAQRQLGYATQLSAELNLSSNYLNLLTAHRIIAVTADPADRAASDALVELLRHDQLRYFARRHGHAALAIALCLRGELAGARAQLAAAAGYSVGDDARGLVRLIATEGCLAAVQGEAARAEETFARGAALALRHRHIDLYAEIGFLRRLTLDAVVAEPTSRAVARADITRLAWARDQPDLGSPSGRDDALLALARAQIDAPRARWIDAGLVGLAAVGLPPGKVIATSAAGAVIRGDTAVTFAPTSSDVSERLIAALARGAQTKAQLVKALWGIAAYHPRVHDGTLYTAVSRLRRALGVQGGWIEKTLDGYQLQAGVVVTALGGPRDRPAPAPTVAPSLHQRLVAVIAQAGSATCADAARASGVSPSTALRALRTLVSTGELIRVGHGAATKYAAAHA